MAFEDPMQAFSFEERKPLLALLEPGEGILWADRPDAAAASGKARTGILVSLGWMALIIWLFFFRPGAGAPWFVAIPFLLVGVWLLLKSLGRARHAKGTIYVLTERRAMILRPTRHHVFRLRPGMPIDFRDKGRGRGDILFDRWEEEGMRKKPATADGPRGATNRLRKVGFKDIKQVSVPHAILQELTSS